MIDYLRTADNVRSFCHSADQVLTDAVHDCARAYHDACQEVNARLRRCEEFLQKGLRSEAIQLAETEPILLDAVAVLDFPERSQWDQLTGLYGLPAAPALRLDTAEALNRAYAEQQPLQQLLRTHRRLNLKRSSLRERLATLRELHKYDGANPVWLEDIRGLESARHRELAEEIEVAIKRNDSLGIDRLWEEVRYDSWIEPPPVGLINRLQLVYLGHIGDALRQAMNEGNFTRAVTLREKWESLGPQSVLAPSHPILQRAAPALEWLNQQQQHRERQHAFERAVASLQQALRIRDPVDRLRELWADATRFGLALPTELQTQYMNRVEETQRQRDYREKLILVSVFSGGALILVTALAFAFLRLH